MFDENGLRKVMVGFNSTSFDELYAKYGLVDKNGNFVAQPIYDEIQFHTAYNELIYGEGCNTTILPKIFIGGYTQVVRDGKMGLMNTKGEEVIPCQYDFVSLPSEGMCRVLNRKEKSEWWFLGYWNLEKNKEVVAPGKYLTISNNLILGNVNSYKQKPEGDFYAMNDFIEGYAMVFTSIDGSGYEYYNTFKATIIDKNGKEVLKKSYTLSRYYPDWYSFEIYPQKGPYLCFQEPVTIKDRTYKTNSGVKFTNTFNGYASGLAGPEGVLIKPSYTAGIAYGDYEAPMVIPATFQIITKHKKILTTKEIKKDIERGAGFGVIDFSGKTFIPFEEEDLVYNEKENTFTSYTRIYTTAGEKA